MDLQGHANYFSCCVTTTTKPMATRHGKVVTYYKKLQPIKLHTLSTRGYVRSCDFTFITWSSDFDFIRLVGLKRKRLSRHPILVLLALLS